MQQTDKYKLNKPGIDDPISPAPLNENADTLDAALNGLNQRILTLENCRILLGTYYGIPTMKERRPIDLGERPAALLISHRVILGGRTCLLMGDEYISSGYVGCVWLTDTGFEVNDKFNENGGYSFVAFFGDWKQKHIPKPEA
jgi:hypothetical protein